MRARLGLGGLIVSLFVLLIGLRTVSGWVIDYQWWQEMGQVDTWWAQWAYGVTPALVAAMLLFIALWITHSRAVHSAGASTRDNPLVARIALGVLLFVAFMVANSTIDSWVVIRYFGGRGIPANSAGWHDPVFGKPLTFYFFTLPFYESLVYFLTAGAIVAALVYWLGSRLWILQRQMRNGAANVVGHEFDLNLLLHSPVPRVALAIGLCGAAAGMFLSRYDMLHRDHSFMVGIDYVAENVRLPLNGFGVAAFLGAALMVLFKHGRVAIGMILLIPLMGVIPAIVNGVYVKPNEISLQRPYVERHIKATREAYALTTRAREVEFKAVSETKIDASKHRPLLDNVRLWDWTAFHDTVSQIQPLRPYTFADTDVDRYVIDGQLRQVLLAPRELELKQLGDARNRWINPHFIYTHGYGIVLAEANRITPDGLPQLFIKDAPPQVLSKSLQLTRPEIYYSEVAHEPVFVHTAQPEFNYPSGSDNVHSKYEGTGGFPISSLGTRLMAAMAEGDWNILLTSYLTPESRMMIHRDINQRLALLAPFLRWDYDPYMVLTPEGRLVWIVDGYTVSDSHPYSRVIHTERLGTVNYIRNSVKATIDAYDGTVKLYIFDPNDPIIEAYRQLFPKLLTPASEMPASLRAHARYPETLFQIQASMYQTFHMSDPEAFYNKVDVWDFARGTGGQEATPLPLKPTYAVATLPGETKAEFLLMIPFTPRGKDNLIGMMIARCDGENLGELTYLQLQKQQLVFGPMQIEARLNQDQVISKDLTLWNQQGSRVLKGQMLVLPVENTFLYVTPIYLQASQGKMPQLKKVVLAMGNQLIYSDSYDDAIGQLTGARFTSRPTAGETGQPAAPNTPAAPVAPIGDARLESLRQHMKRYRELAAQGKWSEAGRELEAVEAALGQR